MKLYRNGRLGRQKLSKAAVDPFGVGLKLHRERHVRDFTVESIRPLVRFGLMAVVRPFLGLRYSSEAGPIERLVAPPYDVLTPAERDGYAVRSPHNVVHLTLPEAKSDDRSKYVKYARSAATLAEWRREGILLREERPAFYRYTQTFHLPHDNQTYTRTSVIVLLKNEPYETGTVLPHERTFPKHKEDRLRILEATRSHLEEIFGLFEDPDGRIHRTLVHAAVGTPVQVTSDDGVVNVFEPIVDAETIDTLVNELADKKVWIADGHHRYETSMAFRAALGERDGVVAEDFLPIALCSMSDPGLVLLPTHRILARIGVSSEELLARLGEHFDLRETHSSHLPGLLAQAEADGTRALALALEGGIGYLLMPKDEASMLASIKTEGGDRLRGLDVTILHSFILEQLLGLTSLEDISYTRSPLEAIRAADQGAAAAFLMNPPTVEDMQEIALGGERMPQKSTYYFPKILSGLVMWSLSDF